MTVWPIVVPGGGAVVLVLLWVRRSFAAVSITGSSMEPAYHAGDRVLIRRSGRRIRRGEVVVVEAPHRGAWTTRTVGIAGREWLIKRVAAVAGDPVPRDLAPALAGTPDVTVPEGSLVLFGDAGADSYDSKQVGYFPSAWVLGTVVRLLPRAGQ